MQFFEWLLRIDRRIVYLFVFLAVVLPFVLRIPMVAEPNQSTKDLYNAVDALAGTGKPILFVLDFDPGTKGELYPMAEAVLVHCFEKNIPVISFTFMPNGPILAQQLLVAEYGPEYKKEYGKDYVFLGYQPVTAAHVVMLQMGEDFHKVFKTDYKGTGIQSLPIMKDVRTYDDVGLVLDLSGTGIGETWISYAVSRYQAKFGMGVTAVMSADLYPYLQTGQAVGMLNGLAGAAEYEYLLKQNGITEEYADASAAMASQSYAHLIIILFIVVGNIAFVATRLGKRS